jgi:S1-C subfamily serine protease
MIAVGPSVRTEDRDMHIRVSHLAVAAIAVAVTYAAAQVRPPEPLPIAPSPPRPEDPGLSPDEAANVRVYQQVNRGVVNITTRGVQADDLQLPGTPREGTGSGSILDKKGHVVTNYHVIEDARQTVVTLYDSSTYEAKLVGADPNNDLAVLQIQAPPEKLFPIAWGDSSKLLVGLRVFAIGNPFGLERTLTTGIVSSLNRSLRSENNRMIRGIVQTDAAINPGNSGGPLLNRRGEMIGITTAIVSRTGTSSGVGLAVPSNTARRVVEELLRYGKVIRADCGIFSVYEVEQGLLIARLAPDGAAEKAGLRGPGRVAVRRDGIVSQGIDRSKADLILAVNGKAVRTLEDLLTETEKKRPGEEAVFRIMREGERREVAVVLGQAKN